MNAGLAVAMLRHQQAISVPASALRAAMGWAEWPARLQHLHEGELTALLPPGAELWLDGGHNPAAARAIGEFFRTRLTADRPFHIILGLLENKDASGFLQALGEMRAHIHAVPVPGHAHHAPNRLAGLAMASGFAGTAAADPRAALSAIAADSGNGPPPMILIAGSLYLAGRVLAENGTIPD
jgi:dihydrofolate synthase/folylpolyglutamate synthase